MIDVILVALLPSAALAALGMIVDYDRRQFEKKRAAEPKLPKGIYFGKIIGISGFERKKDTVFTIKLDSGEMQISADEQEEAHQMARKLLERDRSVKFKEMPRFFFKFKPEDREIQVYDRSEYGYNIYSPAKFLRSSDEHPANSVVVHVCGESSARILAWRYR